MTNKAHIITYGCQMNVQESGVMAELLLRAGYQMTDHLEDAALVVVETCAIRQKAEDKVYSLLGRLRRERAKGRPLKVVLCGCVVTAAAAGELVEDHGVDVVLGPRRAARIADAVEASRNGPVVDVGVEWEIPPDDVTAPDIRGLSAFVTVMQGCSNACTFCVVPSRRGEAESRPVEAIIAEIRQLEKRGYKEVTLLGQNISYYGLDGAGRHSAGNDGGKAPRRAAPRLADLLSRVEAETQIPRIRFATSHPAYIDERFLETLGDLKRVMPHLHLPVQSGSDRVLKLMRRGYTAERYRTIARALRSARPDAALTTDIITGFDGETEADHAETLALVRDVKFDGAYVFAYSERQGTVAGDAAVGEKVPQPERLRRCREVLDAVAAVSLERREAEIGREVEVLVEKEGSGRTRANILARFEGGHFGQIRRGRVTAVTPHVVKVDLVD